VRASRSDPSFEIYAGLPLAWRMASVKSGFGNDLGGENGEPVGGGAERRPPPCAGNMALEAGEGITEIAAAFDLTPDDVRWALAYETSLRSTAA
jgi:hypothetical protein